MANANQTMRLPNGQDFLVHMPVPSGEANGLLVLVVISSISASAVVILLSAIAISAWNTRKSVNPHMFVRSHAAAYLISLLVCDFLQAIGSLMNARWVAEKGVRYMPFCEAQGAIKQLADVGTAVWTLIIAMHTFWVLFFRWNLRRYVLVATVVLNWSAIALFLIAGPATGDVKHNGPFYGISGYWCWISDGYPGARIALDYMFMFVSAFLSFVLYTLVFLNIRGNILVAGWKWRFRVHHSTDSARGLSADDQTVALAKQMLLYPVAYTCIILPIAIVRFAEWSGADIPFATTIFTDSIYLCSGLINVTLFFLTRRVLPRHSVITKRFTKDPEEDNSEAGNTNARDMDDIPGSYMAEKMDETVSEDDKSEKMFKRVDSPDSDAASDDSIEIPPVTIVTTAHDVDDPHTPHGQRFSHMFVEGRLESPLSPGEDDVPHVAQRLSHISVASFASRLDNPHSPTAEDEDERIISPNSGLTESPEAFSRVSLDSQYTPGANRADPPAYPTSPLAVPGSAMPRSPRSPLARSPSRSAALRTSLEL